MRTLTQQDPVHTSTEIIPNIYTLYFYKYCSVTDSTFSFSFVTVMKII